MVISQLENYAVWVRIGMILKKLGAPTSLWKDVDNCSNKYKPGDCNKHWSGFPTQFSISLSWRIR
ncbi:MAG: PriCT-2 domain-containing protein, partial [Candidatus Fonsibacter sp.]